MDGCDGAATATVQNTECSVAMQTLRDTLGLSYGADIVSKVQATNLVGAGANSTATDSASAAKVETAPQSPSNLTVHTIYDTNVTVSWN